MTEPTPSDNSQAILVAVTRMDGKLDTALAVQAIHSTDLSDLKRDMVQVGNRVSVLETRDESDNANQGRMLSAKTVAWSGGGVVAAVVSAIAAWRTGGGG
jgi:hypothetical protein